MLNLYTELLLTLFCAVFVGLLASSIVSLICSHFVTEKTHEANVIIWLVSWFSYSVTSVGILLTFSRRTVKRIRTLSRQTAAVKDGEINEHVVLKGRSELSELAENIDSMRCSLVDRINGEKAAWQANQELITSISHDIRNPLTTLVGYSDILANGQYKDEDELRNYLEVCRNKAYQLKDLTDQLFGYSLVFGAQELKTEFVCVNAHILLVQLLGEHVAALEMRGYDVLFKNKAFDGDVEIDIALLKRVVDNIFSNIDKYADLSKKIKVVSSVHKDNVEVTITNYIKNISSPVESTRIGIKTCERLCELMGIEFFYAQEANKFKTILVIPFCENKSE